jgi:NAD(P)-dependent dehydrogenase (short-subunit alcohol dehydrogenase family)
MTPRNTAPVLITGCSSGIGRAIAERLGANGWNVFASARRPDSIADLATKGCKLVSLDVTDSASIESAVASIEASDGAVGALINNAGYGLHGAIETTPIYDARKQFDTNFFGLAELTNRVLPQMRAAGRGLILNMSSMGGRFTFPGGGYYHASKHALEAYSDALRYELRPFGIHVVVVEPGLIKTNFGGVAVGSVSHAPDADDPYSTYNQGVMNLIDNAYSGLMGKAAASPSYVARTIERILSARRPGTRYVTPFATRGMMVLRRILPDRGWDTVMRRAYPQPGPQPSETEGP